MLFEANVGMDDVLNQIIWMSSATDIMNTLIATGVGTVIAVVLFGVIQCFFGYRVFRYELGLIGALGVGAATYLGCRFLLHYSGGKLIAWTAFGAFMGAGMLFTVSAIVVFLITLVGTTVALLLGSTANGWDMLPQVMIVLAVAAAAISIVFYRHVIIIGNAVIGAGMIGLVMNSLFESALMGVVFGSVFGVCGLTAQYWMYISGRRRRREREQKEEAAQAAAQTRAPKKTAESVPKTSPAAGGAKTSAVSASRIRAAQAAGGSAPEAQSTEVNYADLFPSQQEVERQIILRDAGLKQKETKQS